MIKLWRWLRVKVELKGMMDRNIMQSEREVDQMRVMLVCAAGASSNVMAKAMNNAAKEMGRVDIRVEAHSEFEFEGYLEEVDAVLFGPHLRSMEATFRVVCEEYDVPCKCISAESYGTLNG